MTGIEREDPGLAGIRRVSLVAPLKWLKAGFDDALANPWSSLFYGACFAIMGFAIYATLKHAYQYVSALVTGFFIVGPFLAIGLYDLSRRRERGEPVVLAHSLDAWRANVASIGVFAVVLAVILLVWARASLVVFALFYTSAMPTLDTFIAQIFSLENLEFLLVYACVGGFFAALVFAISVVAIPMMLDRNTDGIVAALTSLKACATNPGAMVVWGALIVVLVALGFALYFVGLALLVPVIGHASWHAYRALVE